MSVQSICQVAIVAMVVAFVVPGLLLSGVNDNFVKIGLEAFLLIQVTLIYPSLPPGHVATFLNFGANYAFFAFVHVFLPK